MATKRSKPSTRKPSARKPVTRKPVTRRISQMDLLGQVAAINRSQAVIEFKLDGTIITANEKFLTTFGYSLEEIQGKQHSLLVDPTVMDTAVYRQFWERLGHGEYDAGQYKRIGKGGQEVWIQASYNPVLDSKGKPFKVVLYSTDITAEKLQSADNQGQLNAVSRVRVVIEFKLDGTVITANENFLSTFGYSLAEIQGKHDSLFVDPAVVATVEYRQFWERLAGGEFEAGQYKRIGKSGEEYWVQGYYAPIMDMDGKPFKVAMFATDITAARLKSADDEGQLNAVSRARLVAEFKLDGTVIRVNENFLTTFGYSLEEVQGKNHSLFVEPDVVATVDYRQFWERLAGGEYDVGQYRRVGKGGKELWIQGNYAAIMDMDGMPFKIAMFTTDITAGKIESADYEGQLRAVSRAQAVIEFTLDGTVITANDNFLTIFGYSLDEIRGKRHSMFVDPACVDTVDYRQFWERLGRGEYDAGQYKRFGKGGKEVWIQASYNPIMDVDGKPFKVVKYATDITASKLQAADYEGQLKAVSKVQAIIEFKLDGTVIKANDNFLKTFGYSLEEIQGKHHSMFVDPADVGTADYRQFWEHLGHGEYAAGQYKRIGKGGKEVWIQASYNPIMDMDGKPFKIVKYATDITVQRHEAELSIREAELNAAYRGALDNLLSNVMVADVDLNITYMNNTVRQMMLNAQPDIRKDLPQFDVSRLIGTNIDTFHKNPAHQRGMLAALTKTVTGQFVLGGRTLRVVANPMIDANGKRLGTVVEWTDRTAELTVEREVQEMVAAIADGRLDQRIPLEGKEGFFQTLGNGINQLSDSMGDIVSKVKAAAGEVTLGAEEISQGNTNLSQRTEEQASSLEQTASSMEQMTSSIKQTADNAGQANQLAIAAREQADKGGAVVTRAVKAMTEINDASKKIADIIGVIDEIAFQTNLLALNAAVEAARAGEQGRGFAVVATEVRNLAGRSATAAKEIKGLIQDSVKKVEEGSSLVSQSGQTLDQIVGAFKKVSDIIAEIAAASQEQSAGVEEVNKAVMQLDEMTQQNAALVEQATAASQSMAEQAHGLSDMMARYRVSEAQTDAANIAVSAASAGRTRAAPTATAPAAERRAGARPWSKAAAKPGTEKPSPAAPPKPKAAAAAGHGTDQEWKQF